MAGYVKAAPDSIREDWASSGHGHISADPWRYWDPDGAVYSDPAGCAKCHGASAGPDTGFLQYAATGANADAAPLPLGLDCVGCHGDPFNVGTIFALPGTYPELEPVLFPSGDTATYNNASNLCMTCHQGRESGASVDDAMPNMEVQAPTDYDSFGIVQIHYFAAAATLFGSDVAGGYEYGTIPGAGGAGGAPTYRGENEFTSHGTVLNDCIACHMNADVGDDKNHTFMPVPADCATCHGNPPPSFPELTGTPGANYLAIQALQDELLAAIKAYANAGTPGLPQASPVIYDDVEYPYWFYDNGMGPIFPNAYQDFDREMLRAAYNYQTSRKDPGAYIHNGAYMRQLLNDSIIAMGGTPSGTRP